MNTAGRDHRQGSYHPKRRRNPFRPRSNAPLCPVCHKPVRDLFSAITHQESGQPAHFDCILKVLRASNELQPQEKICYLGQGSFGIIQLRNVNSPIRFLIRKRIQYENPDNQPEWRKKVGNH